MSDRSLSDEQSAALDELHQRLQQLNQQLQTMNLLLALYLVRRGMDTSDESDMDSIESDGMEEEIVDNDSESSHESRVYSFSSGIDGTEFEYDEEYDFHYNSDVGSDLEKLNAPQNIVTVFTYKMRDSEECLIPATKPRSHYTLPLVSLSEARETYLGPEIPETDWMDLRNLITSRDGAGILDWFKERKVSRAAQKVVERFPNSPLNIAAQIGSLPIFNFLLGEFFCINPAFHPLHDAVNGGSILIVERLIDIGMDVKAKIASYGRCALHMTAMQAKNMSQMIKLFLRHGAEVDQMDDRNYTPLQLAVLYGSVENVIAFLAAGADVKKVTKRGRPVLHMAMHRDLRMLRLVYTAGARPVKSPKFDEVREAPKRFKPHMLTYLIRRNVPLKFFRIKPRDTALYHAATCLDEPLERDYMVNLLLGSGHPINRPLVDAIEACMDQFRGNPLDADFRERLRVAARNPRSLQDLAIVKVRNMLGSSLPKAAASLPLPEILKDFVQLKHIVLVTEDWDDEEELVTDQPRD